MAALRHSSQNIIEKLKSILENEKIAVNGKLPPERTLAVELGVSRSALRKALMALENEGLIWRHVGRGTFLGPKPNTGQEGISSLHAMTNPSEIMEARLILEPRLAALAALRSSLQELSQMESYLQRSQEATKTSEFEIWDEQLHLAIAKATDNNILISLFLIIHKIRQSNVWGILKEASLNEERKKTYFQQHKDLVEALKDRDAHRAEKIMKEHLETIKKHILEIS